jgi:hypothetical protein
MMIKKIMHACLISGFIFSLVIFMSETGVFAGSLTLSWNAPTQNTDGTALSDLAGYKLYYGTTTGNYTNAVNVGNARVYQVNNLTDGLTYFFAVTAYNTSGNESVYSNEVNKTLPIQSQPLPEITATDSVAPVDDLQIPFGNITSGNLSDKTITIRNDGNADLAIGSVALANPLAAPFSIVSDTCSGQNILPADTCTITARFAPNSTGVFSDSFNIPSNDPDESQVTMNISGTGIAVQVSDIAVTDSVSPASDLQIPFGDLTEGNSLNQTVTVANTGNATLELGGIAQENPLAAPFSIVNDTCSGRNISPASSCTVTIGFMPTSVGTYSDSFNIPSNDPDESQVTVNINGTGLSSVTNNPPSSSDLISPANGQKGLGKTVKFKWKRTNDPDGDTVVYDLYVCTDPDFTTGCTKNLNIADTRLLRSNDVTYAGIFGNSYSMSMIMLLFWIITAVIGCGMKRKKVPLMIALAVVVIIFLVACGGGGTGNESNSGISLLNNVDAPDEVSQTASGLISGSTYYWKVVAVDDRGAEAVSDTWSFTIQ